MNDFSSTVTYKGREYKMYFNINVMEQIQTEYGTVDKWGEMTESGAGGEPDAKAVKFGFAAMVNEGVDIENEDNGTEIPHITLAQAGRIVSEIGFTYAAKLLNMTVIESTKSEEKNV